MNNRQHNDIGNLACPSAGQHTCFSDEDEFRSALVRERKRAERSHRSMLLFLVDIQCLPLSTIERLSDLCYRLAKITRASDYRGWHQSNSVFGVLFTDIAPQDLRKVNGFVGERVRRELRNVLAAEEFSSVAFSSYFFPDGKAEASSGLTFYPDVHRRESRRHIYNWTKRGMDFVLSALLLTLFAPLFAVVALLIKLTSKGPVFYRQTRIGRFGKPFVFLKFRSMYVNSDTRLHKDYAQKIIAGRAGAIERENGEGAVYKLVNDPRHTPIAGFLRRTSIDELPQLINVLRGEMSLVGPRPAIPYEVEVYDLWHRRRLIEVLPGITGLWQVEGRGRVTFDEMVRLDLRYASQWSPWMDAQILLRTPRAVITGEGAY